MPHPRQQAARTQVGIALLATGPQPGDLEPQMVDIGMAISLFFRDQVPCMATLSASGLDAKDLMRTFDDVPPPIRLQRAVTGWLMREGTGEVMQ